MAGKRKYAGPLQPGKRSAKVAGLWEMIQPWEVPIKVASVERISVVDNLPCLCPPSYCTVLLCRGEECQCQPCPICLWRQTPVQLQAPPPQMGGIWLGPHCLDCDMEMFYRLAGGRAQNYMEYRAGRFDFESLRPQVT